MTKSKNPLVFLDVCIDGDPGEKMVFEVMLVLCGIMTIIIYVSRWLSLTKITMVISLAVEIFAVVVTLSNDICFMQLFYDVAPYTAENFRVLCTGMGGLLSQSVTLL